MDEIAGRGESRGPDGPRYAVWFAPAPDSALHAEGSRWLGRDAISGAGLAPPAIPGLAAERWAELAAEPRLYGFHATLKPPFRLARGTGPGGLCAAVRALARRRASFEARLEVGLLAGFLALRERPEGAGTRALAAACVAALDGFRARPEEGEIARRRAFGLTPAQEALLQRWGYPWVMEEFRFHMTLTRRLAGAAEAGALRPVLAAAFRESLGRPAGVDAISVFRQDAPGAPFREVRRFPLGG